MCGCFLDRAGGGHNIERRGNGNGLFAFTLPSSGSKAAFVQEGLLVGAGRTAEDAVAVRETPEATDDIGMVFGPLRAFRKTGLPQQPDAADLVGKLLRMHERQVEKFTQSRIDPGVG